MSEETVSIGGASWRSESGTDTETEDPETTSDEVYGPKDGETDSELPTTGLSPVNIRNFSVKCGSCGNYQVIVSFRRIDEDWNEYVYECDEPPCTEDVSRSRTVLEIPVDLDEYARRNPAWRGGKIHAGADD